MTQQEQLEAIIKSVGYGADHEPPKMSDQKAIEAITALIQEAETQMQIDDRLVMLGWIDANKDNLSVQEIIDTLKAQVNSLNSGGSNNG